MPEDAWMNLAALALGFSVAGALASGYQVLVNARPDLRMLNRNERMKAAAAVPFLVLAAPFLIMSNTLFYNSTKPRHIAFVMLATALSGFWSLMSGTVLVALLRATGMLA